MNKFNCKIWNRDFSLDVVFDVYKGETVTDKQNEAFECFQKNAGALLSDATEISKYCLKKNKDDIPGAAIENIFKYVIPQKLYVCRSKSDKREVALLCAYKFDPEHGIAIVFENEKLVKIGQQDIVL